MPAAASVRVLLAELATLGLDPARLCADAGADPSALADRSRPFGLRALGRVLARAEEVARDPHLGLHLAERAQGRGLLSHVYRAQPTVERGIEEMARVAATVWGQPDALRVARRGRDAALVVDVADVVPRHALEFVVARLVLGLRASGTAVRGVRFRHPGIAPVGEYARVLGVPVRFRCRVTALDLDAAALARPIPTANADAAAALAAGLDRPVAPPPSTTAARTVRAIEAALADGRAPDREVVARALGMSGRTLARRLAGESAGGFHALLERTRRDLARRLVEGERLPLGEVASRVGFADQAAFGKAFRRWFGSSPSAHRARRAAT